MTDTTVLYSTIATIVGVWITIVISLSLVLFTHIINQNIQYFTLLRNEKRKLYPSIHYLINDAEDITFTRVFGNKSAKNRCTEAQKSIKLICDQPENKIRDDLNGNVADIYENIKTIVLCYPHPQGLGGKFLFTEELLIGDDEYESWITDYKSRIDYSLNKTLKKLESYLNIIKQNDLNTDTKSKVSLIENVMEKLRIINQSIYEIETLKRDYKPIVAILEIIENKLTIWSILGTLFFGVLLPLYMLLPKHFDLISENVLIFGIFGGLLVCYCITLKNMKQLIATVLKK